MPCTSCLQEHFIPKHKTICFSCMLKEEKQKKIEKIKKTAVEEYDLAHPNEEVKLGDF